MHPNLRAYLQHVRDKVVIRLKEDGIDFNWGSRIAFTVTGTVIVKQYRPLLATTLTALW
jgi:hypothetical protein